jgi:hypothetical protein
VHQAVSKKRPKSPKLDIPFIRENFIDNDTGKFTQPCTLGIEIPDKDDWLIVCQYGILVLACFNSLMEVTQFLRSGRRYLNWSNLFDWVVYVMAILLVLDVGAGATDTGIRTVSTHCI